MFWLLLLFEYFISSSIFIGIYYTNDVFILLLFNP